MTQHYLDLLMGSISLFSAFLLILAEISKGKTTPLLFTSLVLTVCTGNTVTGLYRITTALGMSSDSLITKLLSRAQPANDIFLILSGLILSYIVYRYQIKMIETQSGK